MRTVTFLRIRLLLAISLTVSAFPGYSSSVYQRPADFISEVFQGVEVPAARLWLNKDLQKEIHRILGHDLGVLRLRYWGHGTRTAWILEEVGKEQPITAGIVVNAGRIEQLKVLIFRETRGGEIRYPFFTDQFKGAFMEQGERLSKRIDGISGATLSVRAVTKLARLALLLHRHSNFADSS